MLALLLAAQVAAATPEITTKVFPPAANAQKTRETPNLFREPDFCRKLGIQAVDPDWRLLPQDLADLPRAQLEYAVDRQIGACHVRTILYTVPDQGADIRVGSHRKRVMPGDAPGRRR